MTDSKIEIEIEIETDSKILIQHCNWCKKSISCEDTWTCMNCFTEVCISCIKPNKYACRFCENSTEEDNENYNILESEFKFMCKEFNNFKKELKHYRDFFKDVCERIDTIEENVSKLKLK